MSAGQAQPQVEPPGPGLQALLAALGSQRRHRAHQLQVRIIEHVHAGAPFGAATPRLAGQAAPHIVRLFAGADHRVVLPGSALLGALLVISADLIARIAVPPAELPIGMLTSALGGPFFLWLLSRFRRELF